MSLFGKMFKRPVKPTVDDPVFGKIEFTSKYGVDMWCHTPTEPEGHMILVDAPLSGPTDAQRRFYSQLLALLAERETECKAFISAQKSSPATLEQMEVYLVEIGPDNAIACGEFVIELADKAAIEIHRVEFRDGKPEVYRVDD